jgi:hypothetical protein
MQGLQYARVIPMPATFWKSEAKLAYITLRTAIIAFVEEVPSDESRLAVQKALNACAHVYCHDDLLLLTSVLQVKNIVRTLASFPDGCGWGFIKDAVAEVADPFNKENCTNARVCAIFAECGSRDWNSTVPSTWKPREIAGQTFWGRFED